MSRDHFHRFAFVVPNHVFSFLVPLALVLAQCLAMCATTNWGRPELVATIAAETVVAAVRMTLTETDRLEYYCVPVRCHAVSESSLKLHHLFYRKHRWCQHQQSEVANYWLISTPMTLQSFLCSLIAVPAFAWPIDSNLSPILDVPRVSTTTSDQHSAMPHLVCSFRVRLSMELAWNEAPATIRFRCHLVLWSMDLVDLLPFDWLPTEWSYSENLDHEWLTLASESVQRQFDAEHSIEMK